LTAGLQGSGEWARAQLESEHGLWSGIEHSSGNGGSILVLIWISSFPRAFFLLLSVLSSHYQFLFFLGWLGCKLGGSKREDVARSDEIDGCEEVSTGLL
jgi:hypothetical protein